MAPPSNRDAVQIPIKYYLVAGKQDPVRIDIPKGTYVPTFHEQTGVESDSVRSSKSPDVGFEGSWPTVLIRPFQNLSGDLEKDFLGAANEGCHLWPIGEGRRGKAGC